ncbi:non-ribosomal peptide synthetase [Ruminiclostridium josui]|uniref:non-ribosomal peptide synthetase n=1 Tax=Ruminiclostridium josui TaxID=1499 RepID=UPI0004671020|nr:non-ribosomal peptide synthetase [Ruminiclostridium josui]
MSFEYPLSLSQQMIWNLQQSEPTKSFYNEGFAFKIIGPLNPSILEEALMKTLEKHSVFKSSFIIRDGIPIQQVQSLENFKLRIEDVRSITTSDKDEFLENKIYQETIVPFDFEKAPLCRAILYILGDNEYLFQFVIHHMICDGYALGELTKELSAIYNALACNEEIPNKPAKADYSDYVNWLQQWEKSEEYSQHLEYWKKNLQGLPMSNLPTDYKRPKANTYSGKRYSFYISEEIRSNLRDLSKSYGVTLPAVFLTILQILVYRYGGQSDFGMGVPVLNRSKREFRGIFGIFVNMIVFRCGIDGQSTFEEHLKSVWEKLKEDYRHDSFPFHRLVSVLPNQRNSNYNPFYETQFVYRDFGLPQIDFKSMQIERVSMYQRTSKVDINFILDERPDELFCMFEYNDSLFHSSTIERMVSSFFNIIDDVIKNPRQKIGLLSLMKEDEVQNICNNWNHTEEKYPLECIHELIEKQAALTPDRCAICFEDQEISYKDLNNRANALARFICGKNSNPNIPIGVCLDRSPSVIIALLAVLKSGHPYIAIDPNYPDERISYMLDDADISLIITEKTHQSKFLTKIDQCILIDEQRELIEKEDTSNLNLSIDLDKLFYIIYTSGSTGKPKGVPIRHRSISNLLYTMKSRPGIQKDDVVLAMASISFDMSVPEIYLPLITGAKVILLRNNEADLGPALINTLEKHGVTMMCATPTAYRILVESGWEGKQDLKILAGGEGLSPDLAKELLKKSKSVWNGYGPSEAVFSSFYEVGSNPDYNDLNCTPLGFPIANTQYYVVDENCQVVPIGVAGELLIGGECLSPGYLNKPQLTKEKFIDNPWNRSAHAPLYKSGDLVKRLPDGNIEFLGRIDHQVKIRGFRIEIEEIEAVLNEHEEVIQSVVIAKTYNTNDRRLVAYIVPRSAKNENLVFDLKDYLSLKLPAYMIPSAFCLIEKMPLTPSGKIDRKNLPEEALFPIQTKTHVEPQSDVEKAIASVWKEFLHISEVDVNDSFFNIGGDSLVVVFVANKLSELMGQKIPAVTIFEYPTLKGLAEYLSKNVSKEGTLNEGT